MQHTSAPANFAGVVLITIVSFACEDIWRERARRFGVASDRTRSHNRRFSDECVRLAMIYDKCRTDELVYMFTEFQVLAHVYNPQLIVLNQSDD